MPDLAFVAMPISYLNFTVLEDADGARRVQLAVDGEPPAEAEFCWAAPEESPLGQRLQRIRMSGEHVQDEIENVGRELLYALLGTNNGRSSGPVQARFEAAFTARADDTVLQLRLKLPPSLQHLPWEALYDVNRGHLALRDDASVCREPPIAPGPGWAERMRGSETPQVLIVVPEGSGLEVGRELASIEAVFSRLKPAVLVKRLRGVVTASALYDELSRGVYDIVHYIGHGVIERGDVFVQFHDSESGRTNIPATSFAACFRKASRTRLVVLNCCNSEAIDPEADATLTGVAPFLMQLGIPAVVGMRYRIGNSAATTFAAAFYQQLFSPKAAGRVDLALDEARNHLRLQVNECGDRAFITPVLHVMRGAERLFAPREGALPPLPEPPLAPPTELLKALREGRCSVVVGPGVLAGAADRDAQATFPPGPLELSRKLLRALQADEFDLSEIDHWQSAGDWIHPEVLHRVCQYLQDVQQGRGALVEAIKTELSNYPCPTAFRRLSTWNVPVIFYTFIDGFIYDCAGPQQQDGPDTTILTRVEEQPVLAPRAPGYPVPRVLALVRGTIRDEDSLVLTEEDNDDLVQRLGRMAAAVKARVTGLNRSVLFLGLDPRDALARRLAQLLIETGPRRKQGPTYFVWPRVSPADKIFWQKYQTRWLNDDSGPLIERLTHALSHN